MKFSLENIFLGLSFRARRGICFSSGVPVHFPIMRIADRLGGTSPRVTVLFEEMGINLLQARFWIVSGLPTTHPELGGDLCGS